MSIPIAPFTCNICDRTYKSIHRNDKVKIANHKKTKRHLEELVRNKKRNNIDNDESVKRRVYGFDEDNTKYECKACEMFIISKKSNIDRHNESKKHIEKAKNYTNTSVDYEPNKVEKHWCDVCKIPIGATKFNQDRHYNTKKHADKTKEMYFKKH